jgi:ribulose-phosphate 3-epimerase
MIKLAPSILSADFARLGEQVRLVDKAGAELIHVDVMDGHFVPNLTLGPVIVKWIKSWTERPFDVHLMIENPDQFIPDFLKAGADFIAVHAETLPHLQRTLSLIRAGGAGAGVALNPATPLTVIEEVLDDLDFVVLMSVNPGFGGQSFIPASLEKLSRLRALLKARGALDRVEIEVDGGVCKENIAELVRRGATWLVAGSAVYGGPDPAANVRELLALAQEAEPAGKTDE